MGAFSVRFCFWLNYVLYLLKNEALQGHLEALCRPQIMSVGSSEPPRKKRSQNANFKNGKSRPTYFISSF